MDCEYTLRNGILRIQVPRELDHHNAEKLRKETDLLIGSYQVDKLIFDFAHTDFMDSSGIGVIIGRSRKMELQNGETVAEHMNSRIQKICMVSGLHRLLEIE